MAYRYFTRKVDARKLYDALAEETGYLPSWFRDGKSYRVQEDRIGSEKMAEICKRLGLANAR